MTPAPALSRIAVALALAAASSCQQRDASAEQLAQAGGARARTAPKVRTEQVVARPMVQYLETTTVLESEKEIELFPRSPGMVTEVLVEEGDRVVEGQVLARLDSRDQVLAHEEAEVGFNEAKNTAEQMALAVLDARARLESSTLAADQAERDYDRDLRLHESSTVASPLSQKALESSRLARDNALAEQKQMGIALQRAELEARASTISVQRAQAALNRTAVARDNMEITAPFDGIVAERNIRLGDSVGSGEFVFRLTDPLRLRAVFSRPQRELSLFAGAQGRGEALQLTAIAEAIPGRSFSGDVVRVSPTIDALSGNFRVTARLDGGEDTESGPALVPGMLLRLKIATAEHSDALVVPKRAVRREGDDSFLFVVEENSRLRRVEVTEGFTDDDHVEVTPLEGSTLAAGESVIVVGTRDLEAGMEVLIDNGAEAPTARAEGESDAGAEATE